MKTFLSSFSYSGLTLHFTSEYLRVVDHLKYSMYFIMVKIEKMEREVTERE